MGPDAVVVRERPLEDDPTRRVVYEPREDGHFERREQLWRQSIADWHTTGTELIADVTIGRPEDQ